MTIGSTRLRGCQCCKRGGSRTVRGGWRHEQRLEGVTEQQRGSGAATMDLQRINLGGGSGTAVADCHEWRTWEHRVRNSEANALLT